MFRSSFAMCVILGVMFATIGMAAVSNYQPSQINEEPVISETVFEQAAAEPVIPKKKITAKPAPVKVAVPPVAVSPQPKKRRTLSTIQPEHYLDWQEADKLTLRSHQVRLTSDGMLSGRVILFDQNSGASRTINKLNVTFMKAGAVFATVKPGVHGVFQASGLPPGVYGVAVTGEVGFALFTVHIFPALKRDEKSAVARSPLRLEIAAIPSSDVPFVQSVFNPLALQNHSVIPTEPAEADIPKSAHVTKEVVDSPKGSTTQGHTIHLQADGSLIGRVRRLHPESGRPFLLNSTTLQTYFLQNNKVVYQVRISQDGRFRVPNFKQGAYSVITAGKDGIGAIGIRVVPSEEVSDLELTPDDKETQFVSFLQPAAGSPPNFDISLLGPENFEALKNLLTPSQFADLVGGGGALGGGGGGGAGSGLPTELLGLLGLLALLASP